MICLTREQCSEWLSQRRIVEAPYGRKLVQGAMYVQFAPADRHGSSAFLKSLLDALGPFPGALLHMTDWLWDPEREPDPTASLREAHCEHRPTDDAPGFVFDRSEFAGAVDLGGLVIQRGWTCYLYLESNVATLLLWEGDLIDFWSKDKIASARLRSVVQRSGARILHDRVG